MLSYKNYTVKDYWREYILLVLLISNIVVWFLIYQQRPGPLKVYFLDVGQGDAIFVETPTHKQLLIDAGRNNKILSLLGSSMPFGDRSLDIFIGTHPDSDHVGGLVGVRERYKIGLELDNKTAKRGQVINFGDGVKLTILFPDRDITGWEDNDASIVARLDYGESSFLLTGDATIKTENTMIYHSVELLDVDVLKVGHHGSRTSTSLDFTQAISPEYSIISAGKDNTYGHPHKEVINILNRVGGEILSTIDKGTIKFESDGQTLKLK